MKKTKRKRSFKHNIDAANAVINELRVNQKALAVQSTGTGKSYVMREIIEKFPLKNVMVIGPSWKVLTEVMGILDTRKTNCTINYATYMGLARKKIDTLPTDLDAILIDEAHHLPAPVWGKGVKELENLNPIAKVIGFTGTPKRTDGTCISQSHFNGETSKLDYVEAWGRGILPTPEFVNVYFKVDENPIDIAKSYLEKKGITDVNRVEAEKAAKILEIEWNKIKETQSRIIKRYLKSTVQKVIVFFDNIADLENFSSEVGSWFENAGFNPTVIQIHSKLQKDIHDYNWEQALLPSSPGELKLIMSVNMLNEGVHISGTEGVVFLRRTVSSIVYLQQLGRCMKAEQKQQPVVFDFVGNIESAGETISTTFNKTVKSKKTRISQKPTFKLEVHEYGKNIVDTLIKIKGLTSYIIPNKLQEAHKTGDYSEITPNSEEYRWMYYHFRSGVTEYFDIASIMLEEYQAWRAKFGERVVRSENGRITIPELKEALKTGDWSKVVKGGNSNKAYSWVIRHKKGGTSCHYAIADEIWEKICQWKIDNDNNKLYNISEEQADKVYPELKEAHETGDWSKVRKGTRCYYWISAHRQGGKSVFIRKADQYWNELQEWRIKNGIKIRKNIAKVSKGEIVHPKLQKAYETKDYSEITYGTREYGWIRNHMQGKEPHFPIADILWEELQEWKEKNYVFRVPSYSLDDLPKLKLAYETDNYSEIKSISKEYQWLLRHMTDHKKTYIPLAKEIYQRLLRWRKKNGKVATALLGKGEIVHPKLQKAYETKDYSEITTKSVEYLWVRHHRAGGPGRFYPIAEKIWEELHKRKEENLCIPSKLLKAHETGDYSEIIPGSHERHWISDHKSGSKSKCSYYPIADIFYEELCQWKINNDRRIMITTKEMITYPKLLKAHETGDYSEIKTVSKEYIWIINHKNGGSYVHYKIADELWKEYQDWRRRSGLIIKKQSKGEIVHPKLQKAYETKDYSEITYGSREYRWILSHIEGGELSHFSIADILFAEYQEWEKKNKK